ncbi:MAG: type II toxin-antitoxin system Phd/YefM family antitoxin [Gammaproteobacteria bacterium]
MREIGAYEAKTHLPRLLKRVEKGERFIITRHGKAIAELTPVHAHNPAHVLQALDSLREFRKTHSLGGLKIRDLIHAGHKR